jgi:hypothetical protein
MASPARMDLACRLRRSSRSSHLPASLGSHQSSLPDSATAWTQATWTALTLTGTMPYVVVRVHSLASAVVDFFMHLLYCSLTLICPSNQTPSHRASCLLNHTTSLLTIIFAPSFARACFQWPRPNVDSAASVFAVSNCSPRLLADSMRFAVHRSRVETTRLFNSMYHRGLSSASTIGDGSTVPPSTCRTFSSRTLTSPCRHILM